MDEPTRPVKFCFGPEDEDSIEGMKKLIVEEVHLFPAEIMAHVRAAGRVCRWDGWTPFEFPSMRSVLTIPSASYVLPIPPRGNSNSLMVENRRATSGFTR